MRKNKKPSTSEDTNKNTEVKQEDMNENLYSFPEYKTTILAKSLREAQEKLFRGISKGGEPKNG